MKNDLGFNFNEIKGLHLELTTRCNAMCPMCNRNFKGKTRKELPDLELTLKDIKKILVSDFLKQLELISICGVYGDPICNNDLKLILKYFYECNPNIEIDIYTNGSLYSEEWWKDLATIMRMHRGSVVFGIDGIGQVHTLHRCNTDYNKVISNAKAFIDAGGNAQWDFLVFKHNEKSIGKAKKLSIELGFKSFQIKKSSRFLKHLYEKDKQLDSTLAEYGKHPVFDKKGNIKYFIELPKNPKYRNESQKTIFRLIKEYGSFNQYLDKNKIECESIKNGGIFISAGGEVFPCCTVYQQVCYKTVHNVSDVCELNEYNLYKNENLSSFKNSIKDIVEGDFFKKLYIAFQCDSIEKGKPKSCARTCGKYLDMHKNSHTTSLKYGGKK